MQSFQSDIALARFRCTLRLINGSEEKEIITDRVRSTREGYVLTRVCPSINLSVHRQVQLGGGLPLLGGGYPCWGVPLLGYPLSDLAMGYPNRGVPHLRNPLIGHGRGSTRWGVPPRVVLDTLRSVCLLRSRRRTF